MEIKIENKLLTNSVSDILILHAFENEKTLTEKISEVDKALNNLLTENIFAEDEFKGKFAEFYTIPSMRKISAKKILLVGLGKKEKFTPSKLREIAAKTIQKVKTLNNISKVGICLDNIMQTEFSVKDLAKAYSEGLIIGNYKFDKYKTKTENTKNIDIVEFFEETIEIKAGIELGQKISYAVNYARDLINESAQLVTPAKLAEIAKGFKNVEVKVFDKPEIEQMKMGAFLAVGQGSVNPPKFIHIKYSPENAKAKIALIGKGITFDSGGLDIKPASSMLTMKDDMSGAASILAIMNIISELGLNIEVNGIIAACENMPSGSSYKPGDILTAKNGKTIEVDNTDAEGRLTLADALCYADELNVDEIIDIATLTGACMVALGSVACGIMGTNQKMIDSIIKAGEQGGEKLWQLPMYEEYGDSLKSDFADMKNTGSRYGGASTAAIFLKKFVKNNNWSHIDIAGCAFLDKSYKELSKGATGAGIRTIINYLLSK